MSGTDKAPTVAFHTKAVFEGDVENTFRIYAGVPLSPAQSSLRRFIARMMANVRRRRTGKSLVLALIAVFLACLKHYRQFLQKS
jgi:hypothetical protein